jgi:hypothetical protein
MFDRLFGRHVQVPTEGFEQGIRGVRLFYLTDAFVHLAYGEICRCHQKSHAPSCEKDCRDESFKKELFFENLSHALGESGIRFWVLSSPLEGLLETS